MADNSSPEGGVFAVTLEPALGKVVHALAQAIRARGGRLLLVGGCVRDALLGQTPKDADAEVFGIPAPDLEEIVTQFVKVDWVGRSFGVLKVRHLPLDISMPRRERKTGEGHKDFLVSADPFMTPLEAAARRDFTINAISWDPLTGETVDPFDGRADLAQKRLRHTSERFAEDPLRVLRAMQFLARFDLTIAPETLALCRTLSMKDLSRERVGDEWQKLLVKGEKPSRGLDFLRESGWVDFFPELKALIGCAQDPKWHPEGDVWTHTLHALDAFAQTRVGDPREDFIVGLAVLCHDLGKPSTTQHCEDGHIRSWGHDLAGEAPARAFLDRLTGEKDLIEAVVILVTHHMRILELYQVQAGDSAIRRLAQKVERLDRLVRIDDADRRGRPPVEWGASPQAQWILSRAEALSLKDRAPKPILQGRHLIAQGLPPSPAFKPILAAAFEAQLDGAFSDEPGAVKWLTDYLATQQPKA